MEVNFVGDHFCKEIRALERILGPLFRLSYMSSDYASLKSEN